MAFSWGPLSPCAWALCSAWVVLPLRSVLPSGARPPGARAQDIAGGRQTQPPLCVTPAWGMISSVVTQVGRYVPRSQREYIKVWGMGGERKEKTVLPPGINKHSKEAIWPCYPFSPTKNAPVATWSPMCKSQRPIYASASVHGGCQYATPQLAGWCHCIF